MRRVLLALSLALAFTATAQHHDPAALATQALDRLDAARYAEVEALSGPQMAAAVPPDKLKAVWESLPAQVGKANGRGEAHVATSSAFS